MIIIFLPVFRTVQGGWSAGGPSLGRTVGHHRVKHACSGRLRTAGDDGGRPGIVRDGRGQYGTVVRNTGMGGIQGMIVGTGMVE